MTSKAPTSKTVFGKLIQPLSGLIQQCKHKRKCHTLTDRKWIETGLLRIFSLEPSGRAFLQQLFDAGRSIVKRSHFFETLKSKRRLKLCREVSLSLYDKIRINNQQTDPLAGFAVLDDYDIYAGDGHYHAAAAHDIKKSGKKYPTQHFYCVDMRSYGLRHLALADTSGIRKREHDTRALKRLEIDTLRQSAHKGRKVIYIWDRAGIDFSQWFRWKQVGGIYFVSREKKNMKPLIMADLPYDRKNPINAGVQRYQLIGCSAGVAMYRIEYKCPLSGETYGFVTSLTNVPPGLIAYLYKLRWDIEKIFDQVKNKLLEKKAWATSDTAKNMQAQFICIAHNLLVLLEKCIEKEGVVNVSEDERRRKRLTKVLTKAKANKGRLPPFLTTPKRPSQLPVKFIRWIRNHLHPDTSWRSAMESLERVYAVF